MQAHAGCAEEALVESVQARACSAEYEGSSCYGVCSVEGTVG